MRIIWRRRRAAAARDCGFALIEVIVAMVILLIAFTATAGLLINTLTTSQRARQQQAANQLADQAMEQVRALPYATVVAGSTQGVVGDSAVTSISGVYYYGTEALDWNSTAAGNTTPLDTYPWPTKSINGTVYTTKTFVTCEHSAFTGAGNEPSCTDTSLGTSDQLLYKVSVIVTWTPNGQSVAHQVLTQSTVYSPKGCQSTLTHPIAAPCEPFFYGSADTGEGTITLAQAPPDPTTGISGGPAIPAIVGFSSADLTMARATASLQSEQTANVSAGGAAAQATWTVSGTDTTAGGTTTNAQAGSDAGATAPSTDTESLTQAAGSQTVTSPDGQTALVLSEGAVSSGSMFATTSSASPATCWDTASVAQSLATNLPCSSSKLSPGGSTAVLTVPSFGPATLAQVTAPSGSAPLDVFTGRFAAATGVSPNQHCATATASGAGCEGSGAVRSPGDITLGGLPVSISAAPPGWNSANGMVHVAGYTAAVNTERGQESTNPSPSAAVTGGSLVYYNGHGYTTINLATATAGQVITLPSTTATGGAANTVTMSGTITLGSSSQTTSGSVTDCLSAQCVATAKVTSFVVDLVYTVASGGSTVANLEIKLDLGILAASATYQAAPNGS